MAGISQIKLPNGDTFDLIDEKSGYITAQYIENKTDYSIPVSRVGEIEVGETVIGTDSTNFPTSKAVVDYVDERVVQEMAAIDVGVESINGKTGAVTISASDVGAATQTDIDNSVEVFEDYISSIYVKKTYSVNNTTFNITYSDTPALNLTAQNSSQVNGIGISTSGLSIGVTNLSNGVSTGITIQNNNVSIGAPNGSVIIQNVTTPTNNTDAVNKSYVDTVIPKVYSSTNTGGYLTMATLPKYDGTVV